MQTLTWKKGMFSSTCKIYKNSEHIGSIRSNLWSNKATGILSDKKVLFKKHGIFSSDVHIYSMSEGNKVLGVIREKSFSSTSYIKQKEGETFKFSKHGVWTPKYFLKSKNSGGVTYKGHETSGVIDVKGDLDEALILSGLYLSNQYGEETLLIIIIVMTIIIAS